MICWIGSVDPVDDLCLTNQIYAALLNAFEFKEITEVQNAHLKMLLEDDETRPRGCKYPTPPCARECFAHNRDISYFLNKSFLSLYVYTRGILGCLWAKTLRGNKNYFSSLVWFLVVHLLVGHKLCNILYIYYIVTVRIQELKRNMIKALFNVKSGGVHSIEGNPVKYICCCVAHL